MVMAMVEVTGCFRSSYHTTAAPEVSMMYYFLARRQPWSPCLHESSHQNQGQKQHLDQIRPRVVNLRFKKREGKESTTFDWQSEIGQETTSQVTNADKNGPDGRRRSRELQDKPEVQESGLDGLCGARFRTNKGILL